MEIFLDCHEKATSENTIILFVCPPKCCISIVFVFSWDHCKSQEKLETMLKQNLGEQTKSIMVFSEMDAGLRKRELQIKSNNKFKYMKFHYSKNHFVHPARRGKP